ncbi:MAG: hypothetical protein ACREBU_02195 [Nitrososphaera sp.]
MESKIFSTFALVLMAILSTNVALISFTSNAAFADRPLWAGRNPHEPGLGVIGMADTTNGTDCDTRTSTASSTKAGTYIKFKVPSTISTVQNSGQPQNGVNIHSSFFGDDGKYREIGLYYGTWTAASGSGYDKNKFQFAYGVGSQITKVINLPVVAGHAVELWFVYFDSQSQWSILYDDLNDGIGIQLVNIGSANVKVKSDYHAFMEVNTIGPNSNSDALGLVEFVSIQKATKIAGDGVSLSNWADGFVVSACSPNNGNYGVTYLNSPGKLKLGKGGAENDNGHQFW